MSGRWRWLGVAGALAYLLVDGHPESLLSGLPWRPPSLMLAVLGAIVLWVVWPKRTAPPPGPLPIAMERGRRSKPLPLSIAMGRGPGGGAFLLAFALLVLVLAKGLIGWQALPSGLPGWYFDNSRFQ